MGTRVVQWVRSLDLTPIRRGFAPGIVNYKKGCTRLAATSDKVYQSLAHGQWFSQGTPASSTTKTGRHDIAEILLKVALKHQNQIKSIYCLFFTDIFSCIWPISDKPTLWNGVNIQSSCSMGHLFNCVVYDWTLKYKLKVHHMVANGILLDVSVSSKTKHNKKNTATV